jgi:hypothetical protein
MEEDLKIMRNMVNELVFMILEDGSEDLIDRMAETEVEGKTIKELLTQYNFGYDLDTPSNWRD